MLGKLLKYELKSTARIFFPFYAAVIVLSILNRVLFKILDNVQLLNIPRVITMATYVFLIIGTFVMTFIVVIQRFYKNLLGEEGYLSMTLPVKTSSHILSKGITAFIWIVSTILSTLLSIIIMITNYSFLKDIPTYWDLMKTVVEKNLAINLNFLIASSCTLILVGLISAILMIYTAISFGHLSNKHKVLTSIGAYVAIYAVVQAANVGMLSIVAKSVNLTMFSANSNIPPQLIPTIIIGVLCLQITFSVAYFFITRYILDKKLNLQ